MSCLKEGEYEALLKSELPNDPPYIMQAVSYGQLSIARYYGGCTYNKVHYVYIPATDELLRDDVVKWLKTYRKKAKKQEPQAELKE